MGRCKTTMILNPSIIPSCYIYLLPPPFFLRHLSWSIVILTRAIGTSCCWVANTSRPLFTFWSQRRCWATLWWRLCKSTGDRQYPTHKLWPWLLPFKPSGTSVLLFVCRLMTATSLTVPYCHSQIQGSYSVSGDVQQLSPVNTVERRRCPKGSY